MTKAAPPLAGVLEVVMPSLHPGQIEVLTDESRFKVLRAGRRWRKSGLGVVQALGGYAHYLGALTGGQIGWWVPSMTARYLVADWEPIKGLARQIPGTRIEEANHRVVFPSGGSLLMLSADNPDSGRGLGLDGAVIDEASLAAEALWSETIRAALADKLGWALFLFTPRGMNWCHDLTIDAETLDGWRAWRFASHDNPYLDRDELDSMQAQMSPLVYRQEILAEFVTGGAGMFFREWFHYWWPERGDEGIVGYHLGEQELVDASECWRFATVDLAWTQEERADYTVMATWAVTPRRHLILLDLLRGHFESSQIGAQIRRAYDRWLPGYVAVERATRQLGIIRDLAQAGLPVREVRADKSKEARALPATARMSHGEIWLPRGAPWLKDFEDEVLAFPMGRHDDQVDVLAYAALEIATGGGPKRPPAFVGGTV